MKHKLGHVIVLGLIVGVAVPSGVAFAATVKSGGTCKTVGQSSGALTCTLKGRKKVWAATPVTAAPTTVAAGASTPAAPAGIPIVPGFDGKTISLGYLSNVAGGPFAVPGKALTAGFNAIISTVNDQGGIAGKYKINNIFAETEYNAEKSVAKYTELRDKVVMISQIFGTPNVQAVLPKLRQDGLVGSPISWDAEWSKDPNLLPNGGVYQFRAMNVVDYWVTYLKNAGKKVCAVSHNSAYGDAALEGYEFAQKSLGFAGPVKLKIGPADPGSAMGAVVTQLKAAGCDAVWTAIASGQTTGILVAGSQQSYNPILLTVAPGFNIGQLSSPELESLYDKQVYVESDVAQWGDPKVPGMKQLLADVLKYAPEYSGNVDTALGAGWAEAKTVVALLEKAVALGDLSRDGIKKALAQTGKVDTGGVYPNPEFVEPSKRLPYPASHIMKVDTILKVRSGGLLYAPGGANYRAAFSGGYKHRVWP